MHRVQAAFVQMLPELILGLGCRVPPDLPCLEVLFVAFLPERAMVNPDILGGRRAHGMRGKRVIWLAEPTRLRALHMYKHTYNKNEYVILVYYLYIPGPFGSSFKNNI